MPPITGPDKYTLMQQLAPSCPGCRKLL